jgi:hypothetical protein
MAVETQELAVIKSGISSAMAESAGQFRQAATASAASITKVVKDISNIFAAQRRDLADLSNSINEVVHELEQTNSKFDNLERVFEESLSIQTAMRGDIKTMAISIKNMTDGIYQLDRNMQNTMVGPNGLLSGLTAGLTSGFGGVTSKLGDILLKVGGGAVLGGAAVAGANYLSGGGVGAGGGAVPGGVYEGSTQFSLQTKEGKNLNISEGDIQRLAKISALEAGSLGESGRQAVVDTVLNRAMSGKYGGSDIKSVLSSPKQFSPVNPYGDIDRTPGPKNMEKYVDEVKKYLAARAGGAKSQLGSSQYTMFLNPNISGQHALSTWYQDMLKSGGVKQYGSGRDVHQHGVGKYAVPEYTVSATGIKPDQYANQGPSDQDATPAAMPTAPAGSASTPADTHNHKEETLGKDADKVKGQGATGSLPGGDIVALGRALQQRGIRVSEHPLFGGVHRVHGPNSAHYQGQAIDINATSGNSKEADDPVMGPKFDKLAQELQAAGYTVLWKVRNHFNHIHAQIGGQGIRGGKSAIGGASTSDYTDTTKAAVTPGATPTATSVPGVSETTPSAMVPTPTTPSSVMSEPSTEQATPVRQEAVTPGVSAPMSGVDTSAMMGMMGGMLPGGLGGILGMIGPMLESLLGSLAPTEAYAQQVEQPQNAEMLQALSNSMQATQMINQAAVQTQAQTEQQDMSQFSIPGTAPDAGVNPNQMSYQQAGYSYNYPWDVSWPDWASMIGGNHWSEMRKIKKNMWA